MLFRVEEQFPQEVHQGCMKAAKERIFRTAHELTNTQSFNMLLCENIQPIMYHLLLPLLIPLCALPCPVIYLKFDQYAVV